ncbi:MAG: phosphoribosylformylglycinamidine cyclo-ligase [Syntrophales bacterium LBB04]|nr:phosphoribosylformylglycinamidine cyclo-ligase [Syntrophales bacterium LBB04]
MQNKASYKDAGVDIDIANRFVQRIKPLVKSTYRKEVMSNLGGFGGLFHLDVGKIKDPLLVSTTDGVGTKIKIAQLMDKHDTIGIDLVAMSVNDVIVQGAEPLFFLDYIATGRLNMDRNVRILEGIVRGCQEAGCALIGGETAEMPGFYKEDEYDLAGFCVGVVEADRVIDGSEIRVGDRIIGIASSGLHSNGFSLARHVLFEIGGLDYRDVVDGFDHPLGRELLRPTRIYVKSVLNLIKNFAIRGIVNITGGGFVDNIPRIIPSPCRAVISRGSWETPHIFRLIQKLGHVEDDEMFKVFNMGIGMMVIVPEKSAADVLDRLIKLGDKAYAIGVVEKREDEQSSVLMV